MGVFDLVSLSLGHQLALGRECVRISPKDTLFPHVAAHFEEKNIATIESYQTPAWKKQIDERENTNKNNKLSGDSIVREMNYWLDNIGIVRHDYQIYFHQKMIETHIRKIYEHEWATFESQILQKFNLTAIHQERIIVCPRRFGKTYAVAAFGASSTWCIPNHEIGIFSTGKRAAGKMMALTIAFLLTIDGFRELCSVHNVENLELKISDWDKRKICCYPGTVGVRFLFLSSLLNLFFF